MKKLQRRFAPKVDNFVEIASCRSSDLAPGRKSEGTSNLRSLLSFASVCCGTVVCKSPPFTITTHSPKPTESTQNKLKNRTNFKNCIHIFTRSLEELLILHAQMSSAERAFNSIIAQYQKVRPSRSYPRKSMKPISKWRPSKKKKKQKITAAIAAPI